MNSPKPIAATLFLLLLAANTQAQTPGQEARALAWGDWDADGMVDLYVADARGDRLLHNDHRGGFTDVSEWLDPAASSAATFSDLDGDQHLDLLRLDVDGTLKITLGDGLGGTRDVPTGFGLEGLPAALALRVLDFDSDGRADLLVSTATGEILLHNRGEASFVDVDLALPALRAASLRPAAPGGGVGSPALPPTPSGPGGSPVLGAGSGANWTPGPPSTGQGGGPFCAATIEDFAVSGACMSASSIPTLGMLYPLGIEFFIDSFSGNVGIGTTSPAATLDVVGTTRMLGFELLTDPAAGRVLMSDDLGVGSWQGLPDPGNTLDGAYDQGNPGVGRFVTADAGPVSIEGKNNDALELKVGGSSTGLLVQASSDPGGHGVLIGQNGVGDGLRVSSERSRAGLFEVLDLNAAVTGLEVGHSGLGAGAWAELFNGANTSDAATGITGGTGHGLYGRNGPAPNLGGAAAQAGVAGEGQGNIGVAGYSDTAPGMHGLHGPAPLLGTAGVMTGVAGESRDRIGVSGWSDKSAGVKGASQDGVGVDGYSPMENGVQGATLRTGTYGDNLPAIVGGVHGSSANVNIVDNFAVVGDASGYGVGVLGLGGAEKGQGVLGLTNGGVPVGMMAGVRGVARAGNNDHWALADPTTKGKIGVFGQARDSAAVWGESQSRVGVVGSVGGEVKLSEVPTPPIGVFGLASLVGSGVVGRSDDIDEDEAGVRAMGAGAGAAAALEIHDGALRVSGPVRPAGTLDVEESWEALTTCAYACANCTHDHIMGWQTGMPLSHPLIKADSIILVTVEADTYGQQLAAHVAWKMEGEIFVAITAFGDPTGMCIPPQCEVKVHYLIINPF